MRKYIASFLLFLAFVIMPAEVSAQSAPLVFNNGRVAPATAAINVPGVTTTQTTTSNAALAPIFNTTQTFSGAATLAQPSSGYVWNFNGAAHYSTQTTSSGWNQDTGDNGGRTAIANNVAFMNQNGNGDAGTYYGHCAIGGTGKAGATHWLAEPACIILNGDLTTTVAHSYLNQFEFNLWDNGVDAAGVGTVENFHRTINTGAFGEVWMGDRWQSVGTKAINVGWSAQGLINIGLDTVQATADAGFNGGYTIGLNMAHDQRIEFNSTATPLNGVAYYGNNPGNAYDVYSSGSGYLSRCNNGGCFNINSQNFLASGTNASGSVQLGINNSDSGGSSYSEVAVTHGSGNNVDVRAASGYTIISAKTTALGLGYNGTTYVAIGSDGVTRFSQAVKLDVITSSSLPGCNSSNEGYMFAIQDANSATFNAALVGGGTNHVIAYCNGTGWVVH